MIIIMRRIVPILFLQLKQIMLQLGVNMYNRLCIIIYFEEAELCKWCFYPFAENKNDIQFLKETEGIYFSPSEHWQVSK